MIFEVIPISRTAVDFKHFLSVVKMTMGNTPTKELEEQNKSMEKIGTFYRILEGVFPEAAICQSISYGFMIISTKDQLFKLMQVQDILNLNVTETNKEGFYLALVTATLEQWRRFCINNSTGKEALELRELANKIMDFLGAEGFSRIFWNFNKQLLKDNTIKLEFRQ